MLCWSGGYREKRTPATWVGLNYWQTFTQVHLILQFRETFANEIALNVLGDHFSIKSLDRRASVSFKSPLIDGHRPSVDVQPRYSFLSSSHQQKQPTRDAANRKYYKLNGRQLTSSQSQRSIVALTQCGHSVAPRITRKILGLYRRLAPIADWSLFELSTLIHGLSWKFSLANTGKRVVIFYEYIAQ